MHNTRKIAVRVSGPTTVCGRTTSLSSRGVSISSILIGAGFRLEVRSHRSDPSVVFRFLVTPGQKVEAQSVLCRLRESRQQILGSGVRESAHTEVVDDEQR